MQLREKTRGKGIVPFNTQRSQDKKLFSLNANTHVNTVVLYQYETFGELPRDFRFFAGWCDPTRRRTGDMLPREILKIRLSETAFRAF